MLVVMEEEVLQALKDLHYELPGRGAVGGGSSGSSHLWAFCFGDDSHSH